MLECRVGPLTLRSPLIAAAGTLGSVVDFSRVADLDAYGAAVAKSVAPEPWPGRDRPRMAPAGSGMLNGIGIQNGGIVEWGRTIGAGLSDLAVPVWGSAVAHEAEGFGLVAAGLEQAGVAAIEVNLSCPNLEDGTIFALDAERSAGAVAAVRAATGLPIGAKLSPNAADIAGIASAVAAAGADWVVLTNTVLGAGFDPVTRRPRLSGVVGGYSGPPLKPIALRCVWEVARTVPGLPIIGCGGITSGEDVVEYLLAGACAVQIGTVHFAEPRAAVRIRRELTRFLEAQSVGRISDLVGAAVPW